MNKLNVAYISDIHNAHWAKNKQEDMQLFRNLFEPISADVVILAGDIFDGFANIKSIAEYLSMRFKHILYIPGNHEFYSYNVITMREWIKVHKKGLPKNFHFLDGNYIEIEGIKFGGSASWYDLSYGIDTTDLSTIYFQWKNSLADSRFIDWNDMLNFINEEKIKLKRLINKVDVMITHVMPTIKEEFFSNKYKGSPLNSFFSFDFEKEIKETTNLKKWIFGHTHDKIKKRIGNTLLLCNPLGYPNENYTFEDLRAGNSPIKYFKIDKKGSH